MKWYPNLILLAVIVTCTSGDSSLPIQGESEQHVPFTEQIQESIAYYNTTGTVENRIRTRTEPESPIRSSVTGRLSISEFRVHLVPTGDEFPREIYLGGNLVDKKTGVNHSVNVNFPTALYFDLQDRDGQLVTFNVGEAIGDGEFQFRDDNVLALEWYP